MDWSVLKDPEANLGDDARAELTKFDCAARTHLSQALGTIVNKKLEERIRPWFSRGSHDWADVDVCAAEMRDGILVLHFIADQISLLAGNLRLAGNTSEAESMYRRALSLVERLAGRYDRTVLLGLGELCGEQGRYEEAEHLLRRCWAEEAPFDVDIAEALGRVLRKTGREKDAEEIEDYARRHHWYANP